MCKRFLLKHTRRSIMLKFFRNYQKIGLGILTGALIVSFLFSGVYTVFFETKSLPKAVYVAEALDGSSIEKSKLDQFVHFLCVEKAGKGPYRNLWNDGILQKDCFSKGLGETFFQLRKEAYQKHYETLWKRIKNFRPYEHPEAPFLSAEMIWSRFAPKINEYRKALPETFNKEAFSILLKLYEEQQKFSPEMLKRMLLYYQKQARIPLDNRLLERELGLFGFRSPRDWFPERFLQDCAIYLMNASIYAEREGVKVTQASLEMEVSKPLGEALREEEADLEKAFQKELRFLGLQQHDFFSIFQSILQGRMHLTSLGNSVFVNPDMLTPILEDSLTDFTVEEHRMAKVFDFTDHYSYALFQLYKEAISPSSFICPQKLYSSENVAKTHPTLVYELYDVACSFITADSCSFKIPLKDIWKWQTEDAPFQAIVQEFPEIDGTKAKTPSERAKLLQNLSPTLQKKVNAYAKKAMVKDLPELVLSELNKAEKNPISIKLFQDGSLSGLQLSQTKKLRKLLEKAPLKSQIDLTDLELRTKEELLAFTEDGKGFFQIHLLKKHPQKQILTFEEALETKKLDKLFSSYVKKMHPVLKETHPAIFSSKSEKKEKEETAKILFPCKNVKNAFQPHLDSLRKEGDTRVFSHTVDGQFFLKKTQKSFSGKEKPSSLQGLEIGAMSSILAEPYLHFYTLLEKKEKKVSETVEYRSLKNALKKEAIEKASHEIVSLLQENGAFPQ